MQCLKFDNYDNYFQGSQIRFADEMNQEILSRHSIIVYLHDGNFYIDESAWHELYSTLFS